MNSNHTVILYFLCDHVSHKLQSDSISITSAWEMLMENKYHHAVSVKLGRMDGKHIKKVQDFKTDNLKTFLNNHNHKYCFCY